MKIVIVQTGGANLFSLQAALTRLGADATITAEGSTIMSASHVFFPGVGSAAHTMPFIRAKGLDKIMISLKVPVMGICLGMQIMCDYLQEGETNGIGIFPFAVRKFQTTKLTQHMGWNTVQNTQSSLFDGIDNQDFYFVHGYAIDPDAVHNHGQISGWADYGSRFPVAIQNNNFYGVQFHPEKSGIVGAKMLENFLKVKP